MVYFGDSIMVKKKGTMYFSLKKEYRYCWSENFNVISKVATLYNTQIDGIWNGNNWVFRGSPNFKETLRKYHNV